MNAEKPPPQFCARGGSHPPISVPEEGVTPRFLCQRASRSTVESGLSRGASKSLAHFWGGDSVVWHTSWGVTRRGWARILGVAQGLALLVNVTAGTRSMSWQPCGWLDRCAEGRPAGSQAMLSVRKEGPCDLATGIPSWRRSAHKARVTFLACARWRSPALGDVPRLCMNPFQGLETRVCGCGVPS